MSSAKDAKQQRPQRPPELSFSSTSLGTSAPKPRVFKAEPPVVCQPRTMTQLTLDLSPIQQIKLLNLLKKRFADNLCLFHLKKQIASTSKRSKSFKDSSGKIEIILDAIQTQEKLRIAFQDAFLRSLKGAPEITNKTQLEYAPPPISSQSAVQAPEGPRPALLGVPRRAEEDDGPRLGLHQDREAAP
jgi:hypothetical protein